MIKSISRRPLLAAYVLVCLVFVSVSTNPPAFSAEEPGDTDTNDLSFLEGLTLVVLENGDIPTMHEAKDLIHSRGGHIAIMSPPSVLLGWVPYEVRDELIGQARIKDIFYTDVFPGEVDVEGEPNRMMVDYFNRVIRGEIQKEFRLSLDASSDLRGDQTRLPDKFDPPPIDENAFLENLRGAGLDIQSLKDRGIYPEITDQSATGNSDYMTGTIAVSVFFVESDGSGSDPDQYTWPAEAMAGYMNAVNTGLTWWVLRALSFAGCSATFLIYPYSAYDSRCQQWIEPILHNTDWEDDWVMNIMSNFGYNSGGAWSRVYAFNTWQRSTYQTDRAYSAFIVYNPPPAPAGFIDGHTAYAYYYGPYTVLVWRLGSPNSQVFAHETGHIFGACDEYASGCSHCGTCTNGVDNGNCEICSSHPTDCMMQYNDWNLCAFTPGHLGWNGVTNPCTPTPPPPLATPTVAVSYPPSLYHGLDGSLTVGGANFFAGAWVDLGPDIFIHKTTLLGAESLKVDVTVFPDAPPGYYDVVVRNRDFQEATLPGALHILPTTRHYYSPSGGDNYPYLVPADAATTLEDAIAAGYSGDTLFVPTGTYTNFNLDLDKGVLLYGAWNSSFTTRDLATGKTHVQLNGNISILPGATYGGLDGFIVENSVNSAIRVFYEAFTVANCELRYNAAAVGSNFGAGGAIAAEDGVADIRNNYFHDNTATLGGAIYLENCSGTISGNTISNNTVSVSTQQPHGGAVYLSGCDNVVISGNTIEANTGAQDGGGVVVKNSTNVSFDGGTFTNNNAVFQGGGVAVLHSQADFTGVEFDHNNSVIGGGVVASDTSNVNFSGCRFKRNTSVVGGGIYSGGNNASVTHNLFVGNSATSTGGAFILSNIASGAVTGNTLDRNTSGLGAGGLSVSSSGIEVFNNIVSNSTGYGIACSGSPTPTLSYNLVWNSSGGDYNGCSPGTGAVSLDPLFVDTALVDYHLAVHSPAIDAGRPGAMYEDPDGSRGDTGRYGSHAFTMDQPFYPKGLVVDLVSDQAVLTWDQNPEVDIDKYAIYSGTSSGFVPSSSNFVMFSAAGDTSAFLPPPPDTTYYKVSAVDNDGYAGGYSAEGTFDPATGTGETVARYTNRLFQNVPNPFNPSTSIRYQLRERSNVSLVVYDVAGRQVRQLVSANKPRGVHAVDWNGTNDQGQRVSSGIYFYRLQAGAFVQTRKMILLK